MKFILKGIVSVMLASVFCGCGKDPAPPPAVSPAGERKSSIDKPTAVSFLGRWLRTDGDYLIVIERDSNDGKLKVSYFNPNPIHVAKGEIQPAAAGDQLFVELRDANYPGCTYQLKYNASCESLQGTYYQAAQKQTYEVEFIRYNQ